MSEDINQETLAELGKIRLTLHLVVLLVVLASLPAFFAGFSRGVSQAALSWERVTTVMRRQDFPAALGTVQALVARQPDYYYGQAYLGAIYLH
jgi:hypothetical protein